MVIGNQQPSPKYDLNLETVIGKTLRRNRKHIQTAGLQDKNTDENKSTANTCLKKGNTLLKPRKTVTWSQDVYITTDAETAYRRATNRWCPIGRTNKWKKAEPPSRLWMQWSKSMTPHTKWQSVVHMTNMMPASQAQEKRRVFVLSSFIYEVIKGQRTKNGAMFKHVSLRDVGPDENCLAVLIKGEWGVYVTIHTNRGPRRRIKSRWARLLPYSRLMCLLNWLYTLHKSTTSHPLQINSFMHLLFLFLTYPRAYAHVV